MILRAALVSGATLCVVAGAARAQRPDEGSMPLARLCVRDAVAGSPTERTLIARALANGVIVESALRPLSDAQLDDLRSPEEPARCKGWWVRPTVQGWFNSSSSNPDRDGAVWQGKGFTFAATSGVYVRRGVLSLALRPLVYASQNASFTPPFPSLGEGDFRDPVYGSAIDLPYRMGDRMVAALDPGESHVRVDWRTIGGGVSTAGQQWGPARFNPLVLSTDGPGIPRVFLEARGTNVGVGRVSASWQLGLLEASRYTALPAGARSRVASALVATFSPGAFPGVELGGTRFFHVRREPGTIGWSTATLPFSGLLKSNSRDLAAGGFNQLASAFVRVAPPRAGVEVYGELYREDHNSDLRDLIGEPDHASAFTLGLRRVRAIPSGVSVLLAEYANSRLSHLVRLRNQGPIYTHSAILEGHTLRGQTLGSTAVLGGGSSIIAYERVTAARAMDVIAEIRTEGQTAEGGTHAGTPSGAFILQWGLRREAEDHMRYFRLRAMAGYGSRRVANVTLAVSSSY